MDYNICDENVSRKVDSLGRVSIPSGLRSRYGFSAGDELNFSTLDMPGRNYVLMYKDSGVDPKYQVAFDVLKELGCEIPKELNSQVYGSAQVEGQMNLEL